MDEGVKKSGCTAVTCHIVGNKIYTANIGDSRAVLWLGFDLVYLLLKQKSVGMEKLSDYRMTTKPQMRQKAKEFGMQERGL